MNPSIQLKPATSRVFTAMALLCLGFLPQAQAVVPPPDGGYPNFTTAEGTNALKNLTTGAGNTGVGWFSLFSDSSASFNTAVGAGTLLFNNADNNTAVGAAALLFNTTGPQNTAVGTGALLHNTIGEGNTATGAFALFSNTEGDFNTANGEFALNFNTTGERNTAIGDAALYRNTEGSRNTAIGNPALLNNTSGEENTAIGAFALFANNGSNNTATGALALRSNTGGIQHTAIGWKALESNTTGSSNTAIGSSALANNTAGNINIALGFLAGNNVTTAGNVICIGATGGNVSDSCYIRNIWSEPGGSQAVYVNSEGKLGELVSSVRFKDEIKPINQASETIHRLRPVSFRYKAEIEPTRPVGFGLIAEEVEKISSDLVSRDKEGKPLSVRYDMVNAMLLNEFLKEHRKVEEQEAAISRLNAIVARQDATGAEQQKEIQALAAIVKEQAAQIQKVSAQLEASKFATGRIRGGGPAPQVVNNP